jgi:hypothetical protein
MNCPIQIMSVARNGRICEAETSTGLGTITPQGPGLTYSDRAPSSGDLQPLPFAFVRNNHVPGHCGMLESVPTDQRHCFQNAVPLRLWTALRVRGLHSIRTPSERTLSGRGRMCGDLPDFVPTEFPSALPAHYSHTDKRANRETRVDTVRSG